jgi:hypothetical protein
MVGVAASTAQKKPNADKSREMFSIDLIASQKISTTTASYTNLFLQ